MSPEPVVFVVDDDPVTRDVHRYVAESVRLQTQTFESAEQFLDTYDPAQPGCLLLDLRVPGMSGVDLQEQLSERNIDLPVIVVTAHGDVPTAVRALRAGAFDFLEKPVSGQILLDRVREAIRHHSTVRSSRTAEQQIRRRLAALTQRELEVLALVAEGMTSKEIAVKLDVSVNTVQNHRARIMRKMRVTSVGKLVRSYWAVHRSS